MKEILKDTELEEALHGREPLVDSIKLRAEHGDGTADFLIEGVTATGGSCICYKATLDNGDIVKVGTLKEFYPIDFPLGRYGVDAGDVANQLYADKQNGFDAFNAAKEDFYSSYKKVFELKFDDYSYDNFFSSIEIYRGIAKDGEPDNHTLYIWTPGDNAMISFDAHLAKMQKDISDAVESPSGNLSLCLAEEMRTVLQAIKAVAIAIGTIHADNLLHLDIKPQNFGIRTLGKNNGDHVTVSLFDVNTLYSRDNPLARTGGTPYFRAPEVAGDDSCIFKDELRNISTRSDIYSLGATLYNSIVILSDKDRGRFGYTAAEYVSGESDLSDFDSISAALGRSLLIRFSEYNSKADFLDLIITVLKRSLARHAEDYKGGIENYISVGEFIDDLKKADEILSVQISQAKKYGRRKQVTVTAVDKDEYYADAATGSMQCLLYSRPLYDYINYNYINNEKKKQVKVLVLEKQVNVLVLGGGVYSQKFMDIAFEMAQTKEFNINVTVISKDSKKDEERYLGARPEFGNYFMVNGKEPSCDKYGTLRFVSLNDNKEFSDKINNADVVKEALGKDTTEFSYVFISLVDEDLNRKVAVDLAESGVVKPSEISKKSIVSYVCYKNAKASASENKELYPVSIKNTITGHKDYGFLKRMAFNCHLLWTGINVDLQKTYGKFRSAYSFGSSFSNVLSIKYKLHSIGLDFDVLSGKTKKERDEALVAFTEEYKKKVGLDTDIPSDAAKANLDELTMYEHRRWLVNMICSSYKVLPSGEYQTLTDTNKDKKNRKHTCIVPSAAKWALNEGKWLNLEFWDAENLESTPEFAALDELDKMSVRLHRHFGRLAKEYSEEVVEADAGVIRRYLDSPAALAAFNAFIVSMRTIRQLPKKRNDTVHDVYRHCKEKFEKYLTDDLANVKIIKDKFKAINNAFAPVKLANEYTDYKAKDQDIIRGIPFILNYSTAIRLCVPFVDGEGNNEWFSNIAAALVLNPSIVTYLIETESAANALSEFRDKLSSIARVMDGHGLQTKLSLVIFAKVRKERLADEAKKSIEKQLCDSSERIYNVNIVEVEDDEDDSDFFTRLNSFLESNRKSSACFSAVERNASGISRMISCMFGYAPELKYPSYSFDSDKGRFSTGKSNNSCSYFADIPFKVHLNIEDMFIARDRLSVYSEPEMYMDYEDIWNNCYSPANSDTRAQQTAAWKLLVSAIRKHTEQYDQLANIYFNNLSGNEEADTTLYAPSFCRASMEKIFAKFKSDRVKLISADSQIYDHNSTTIKLCFKSSQFVREAVVRILLRNPYALADAEKLDVIIKDSSIVVNFNSLSVRGFAWSKVEEEFDNKADLLGFAKSIYKHLWNKGYLIATNKDPNETPSDFCFASPQIKDLLTNEGRLLELYAYYKTLEQGYFDEVKTSLEVKRNREGSKGEYSTTQEFDMVAVKGFSTQLVEIKARNRLSQDFYSKLKANGDSFGINKQLVVVADFGENKLSTENKELIARGKEDYRIATVCGAENIGGELCKLMEQKKSDCP